MGYDMHVRGLTRPPYKNEDGTFNDEAWAPRYYLRRNIFGMPYLREALLVMGAAFSDYDWSSSWARGAHGPYPKFPDVPQPEEKHFSYDDEGDLRPMTEPARQYLRDVKRTLSWRPERPGIPMHKLSDNSGWIVTPEECREALKAITEYRSEHGPYRVEADDGEVYDPLGDDVIPFLESAAEHDGFEVH